MELIIKDDNTWISEESIKETFIILGTIETILVILILIVLIFSKNDDI